MSSQNKEFDRTNPENNTVARLKDFLRRRKKKCSGSKAELVRLVKLYCDLPEVTNFVDVGDTPSFSTDPQDLNWREVNYASDSSKVPKSFTIVNINSYLTECIMSVYQVEEPEHDEANTSTNRVHPEAAGGRGQGVFPEGEAGLGQGAPGAVEYGQGVLPGTSVGRGQGDLPRAAVGHGEGVLLGAAAIPGQGVFPGAAGGRGQGVLPRAAGGRGQELLLGTAAGRGRGILHGAAGGRGQELLPVTAVGRGMGVLGRAVASRGQEVLSGPVADRSQEVLSGTVAERGEEVLPAGHAQSASAQVVRGRGANSNASDAEAEVRQRISNSPEGDVSHSEDEEEDLVNVGTKKPAVKGRRMYLSERIHFVQLAEGPDNSIFFRANVQASMKQNVFRFPVLSISANGAVEASTCTCQQGSDGRCTHVAALLYYVEDLSVGCKPRISAPTTNKAQAWGKGQQTKKDPQPVHAHQYGKKRRTDRMIDFDPRPQTLQKTTKEERVNFLFEVENLHASCMWEKLLSYEYEDYVLDLPQESILQQQVSEMIELFGLDVKKFNSDTKSNDISVHVTNTEAQSTSDLWHIVRKNRVTASMFKQFTQSPVTVAKNMWRDKPNLSTLPAIKWGLENEKTAAEAYEISTGRKVEQCGFFIHRKFPFLGCSPDGLIDGGKGVIEIKCPYILKNMKPADLGKLGAKQRASFACTVNEQGTLSLKKNHIYYYQVQFQMFVTGCGYCDFLV